MRTNRPRVAALLLVAAFSFTACQKEQDTDTLTPEQEQEAATTATESEAETEAVSNDVFDNVIGVNAEVGLEGVGIFGQQSVNGSTEVSRPDSAGRCFTVSYNPHSATQRFPLRIVIDFGSGCTGRDGRTRYGKISTVYTGALTVPGKSATTTFEGYRIDSISISGTHRISNTSTASQRQFTIEVQEGKISRPSGNYARWNGRRVITQVEGLGTPAWPVDDVFQVSGEASGQVQRRGHTYRWQSEITQPLVKKFTCRWVVEGIVKVRRESANAQWAAILDYGAASCDNKGTLTINGKERQITLR